MLVTINVLDTEFVLSTEFVTATTTGVWDSVKTPVTALKEYVLTTLPGLTNQPSLDYITNTQNAPTEVFVIATLVTVSASMDTRERLVNAPNVQTIVLDMESVRTLKKDTTALLEMI